jgi:acid phosphatase type 7
MIHRPRLSARPMRAAILLAGAFTLAATLPLGGDRPWPLDATNPSTVEAATSLTFVPVADAYVDQAQPTRNFGSVSYVRSDLDSAGGYDYQGLFSFNVTGISGTVSSAKLRLYVTNSTPNAPALYRASWYSETGVTWNTRPSITGGAVANLGSTTTGTWVEYPVTSTVTANGTYHFALVAESTDGFEVTSREGTNRPQLVVSTGSTVIVTAVGDIHSEGSDADSVATAASAGKGSVVLGLGDYQYQAGTCSNFTASGHYDSDWGKLNAKLYPTYGGTHDYANSSTGARADRYMSGDCAGQQNPQSAGAALSGGTLSPTEAYSFDRNGWHIVQLPAVCFRYSTGACSLSSITTWLKADLAAHPAACTIAFSHEPYWSSPTSTHGRTTTIKPWIQAMYDAGVDIYLSGHQHNYERFAPQNPSDALDRARGITQFVVGTGGVGVYSRTSTARNSVAYAATFGVLQLTLRSGAADFAFVPNKAGTYTDSGTITCH